MPLCETSRRTVPSVPSSAAAMLPRPAKDTVALRRGLDRGLLSARGFDRVLRLAWSVADLDGKERPGRADVDEAAQLRMGDRHAAGPDSEEG